MNPRCVNLDWLECTCLEPIGEPHDQHYFEDAGFEVQQRDYGTRVWGQMFTLLDQESNPFIEVRRAPKTSVLLPELCTLRLVNRYCYFENAAQLMREFIDRYHFTFQRISRVDVCLDFEYFDSGDDPYKFIVRYLNGKYSKINQANVHSHGTDRWDGRDWNSLSWGSPLSDVGTKLYDKTMELYDPVTKHFGKPYIRQAWLLCGLVDNFTYCTKTMPDGTIYHPRIWRLEFSVRSSAKKWFVIHPNGNDKQYLSVPNTLDCWDDRGKLSTMFFSLVRHYFHFKYYYEGIRKDRCPDKVLFKLHNQEAVYKVGRDSVASSAVQDRALLSLLNKLKNLRDQSYETDFKKACSIIINSLESSTLVVESGSLLSRDEIIAAQIALSEKFKGTQRDYVVLYNEIRQLLRLNEIF